MLVTWREEQGKRGLWEIPGGNPANETETERQRPDGLCPHRRPRILDQEMLGNQTVHTHVQ